MRSSEVYLNDALSIYSHGSYCGASNRFDTCATILLLMSLHRRNFTYGRKKGYPCLFCGALFDQEAELDHHLWAGWGEGKCPASVRHVAPVGRKVIEGEDGKVESNTQGGCDGATGMAG